MRVIWQNEQQMRQLILEEENTSIESYQEKMLEANRIPGLLPMHILTVNGKKRYYFDVTGQESLQNRLHRQVVTAKELAGVFFQLWQIGEAIEEFLLDVERIVLLPAFIFFNQGSYSFLYFPYKEIMFQKDMLLFTDAIIKESEQESIIYMAQELHQVALSEEICLEKIYLQAKEILGEKESPGEVSEVFSEEEKSNELPFVESQKETENVENICEELLKDQLSHQLIEEEEEGFLEGLKKEYLDPVIGWWKVCKEKITGEENV